MRRREFIGAGLAMLAECGLRVPDAQAEATRRVRPGDSDWPSASQWAALDDTVGGGLMPVTLPKLDGAAGRKLLSNPFAIGDEPGLTQSSGWLDAWRSSPSVYVLAARSAADVAAGVRFAAAHNLRLVIKGAGHSYFGASCAPDSLLIWTRKIDAIKVHEVFTPAGSNDAPVPAVSVGAGCIWLHVYQAVTGGTGRYVQGGGCTTVGVAGLVQGGGFGSFSKRYGAAAASLLEAEIVTADGKTRVVNKAQEPDLFWALKGGGGGTFGVATRFTLATHELPQTFGAVSLSIRAHSDEAYRRLLARFVNLYSTQLFNAHWGEQVGAGPNNRLNVQMVFQGLTQAEARAAWKPLIDFADASAADYEGQNALIVMALPARLFWNATTFRLLGSSVARFDDRPAAAAGDFWWAGNTEEVGTFWHAYTSAWMPQSLLQPQNQSRLVDAWFSASRHWPVYFHFNKGLAGASGDAIEATRDTAMNPDVLDAFALAIIASSGRPAFPGMAGPDLTAGASHRDRVHAAMASLRAAAPDTGCYVNECDYFQPNWQQALWGTHYPRLTRIKQRYDSDCLFFTHHGVGSESWSADGFTRGA